MSEDPKRPPSSAPTELGPAIEDEDGLRWSPRVDLGPGLMLGERYRIEGCIGMGGMATVFRAEHVELGKPVAIKVLGEELARKPALVKRFLQEARAASAVRHENIVEISDFGYVREDLPYYVMEYLEGESLAARLQRKGRLPWPEARHIAMQVCAALCATHEAGVVHRDMKPDNVILVDRGSDPAFVKVLDFGIAKVLSDDGPKGLTRTGVIMGTAAYMSPEQAKSQDIDARTDLYAVGVMLYEMLAGRVPFEGEGVMEVLTKHIIEPVPPLRRAAPEVSAAVERMVHQTLHKDRAQRPASARELLQALERLGEDGRAGIGRGRLAVAVVAVLAAAAVGVWWTGRRDEPPVPVQAPVVDPPAEPSEPDAPEEPERPDEQTPRSKPPDFDPHDSLPPPPDVPVPEESPLPGPGVLLNVDELEDAPTTGELDEDVAQTPAGDSGAPEPGSEG